MPNATTFIPDSEENIKAYVCQTECEDMIKGEKSELLKDLNHDYAGYKENFGNDMNKIVEHFKQYGIKTANLKTLIDIRSWISGNKIYAGIWFGPLVGVLPGADLESSVNHETIHVNQYKENSPLPFLKGRLWFLKFWVVEQRTKLRKMKKERGVYGAHAGALYATKNTPMEFEAFLHEGETEYLETRKPFAYKQYETKLWRSQAIRDRMEKDIKTRIHKIRSLLESLGEKETITRQEVWMIDKIIEELNQEIEDIKDIQKTYEDDDRELIGTMKSAKWVLLRAEPKTLIRRKRLPMLDEFIEREKQTITKIKTYKEAKIITSLEEIKENGIIKVKAKDGDLQKLLEKISTDPDIQANHPNIRIDYIDFDDLWNPIEKLGKCVRISFTKLQRPIVELENSN